MVSLLEIVFATITLVWGGFLVYRQNWQLMYKAAAYLIVTFLIFAMWNRPLAGKWGMTDYGVFIVVLATVGVLYVGNWAIQRWGANNRLALATVIVTILLLLVFWYPILAAGPSSITPSTPSPVASAPTTAAPAPAPAAPASSSRTTLRRDTPQTFDMANCPKISYDLQKEMGCPGVL